MGWVGGFPGKICAPPLNQQLVGLHTPAMGFPAFRAGHAGQRTVYREPSEIDVEGSQQPPTHLPTHPKVVMGRKPRAMQGIVQELKTLLDMAF